MRSGSAKKRALPGRGFTGCSARKESQLWSCVSSAFFFWGRGGGGESGRNFVRQKFCQAGILSGRNFARKGFCQEGILSGRNFVRQGFCQAGILSGRIFVRHEFCQETGSARIVVYFLFLGAGGESASSVWLAQPRLTRVRK